MSSTAFDANEFLDTAERYQRTFVKPLVDAVVVEVRQHLEQVTTRVNGMENAMVKNTMAISALQGNQKKALVGYGVFTSGLAAILAASWTWIKSHFHVSTG